MGGARRRRIVPRSGARALADWFGSLKDEIKERSTEFTEVWEALERFFEETGERAVAGEEYRLTANRSVHMKFPDDEALRAVLKPAGLWEKVLTPAWARKAKLLTDPEVPEEVRAKLADSGAVGGDRWATGHRLCGPAAHFRNGFGGLCSKAMAQARD